MGRIASFGRFHVTQLHDSRQNYTSTYKVIEVHMKSRYALLKLGYAMHTQWYVIHTILLHTSGVFRFGMKYTLLYAHYLMALAPPI